MAIKVEATVLPGVLLIWPDKFTDLRGFFSETYNNEIWQAGGVSPLFVQDNQSFSRSKGTVRGLHFQRPPMGQDKLVRVTRGSIQDVAVDIRKGSPTFGNFVSVELSADKWNQLFIPVGFAHGFCTLEDDTEVQYKVSSLYSSQHDAGIIWNDRDLGVLWQVTEANAVVSDKDGKLPRLADFESPFTFA